jgi:hypothetical protein
LLFWGTGNPAAAPDRSGPAAAIVVNDTAYLVDFRRFNQRQQNAGAFPVSKRGTTP